jgi:hypothetical protein
MAIYLGFSPRHARSVALVLSLATGYASPQFHLKFDDFFETVQDVKSLPQLKWQTLLRFVTETGKADAPKSVPLQGDRPQSGNKTASPPHRTEEDPFEFEYVDPNMRDQEIPFQDQELPVNDERPNPVPEDQELPPPAEAQTHPSQYRHPDATRRSTRQTNPPRRLIETAYAVLDDFDAVEDYEIQDQAEDPIGFAASKSDPDTLHFNAAMNAADSEEFKKAMLQEVNAHTDDDHWEVWAKADIPAEQDVLPAVWAFKRKRRIDTRVVYKHKARLNIHGGKQKQGVNYWETYSPVVNWISIRLCLILTLLLRWKTRQIDFVLAFPQAEVECDIFMQLPRGVVFQGVHRATHCLKLKKNMYGQKQAGRVWNNHLVKGLTTKLNFVQSKVDECVFYQGSTVLPSNLRRRRNSVRPERLRHSHHNQGTW